MPLLNQAGATRPPQGYSQQVGAGTLPTDVADGVATIALQVPIFGAAGSTGLGAFEEAILFEMRQQTALLFALVRGACCGQDFDLLKTPPVVPGTTGPGLSGA